MLKVRNKGNGLWINVMSVMADHPYFSSYLEDIDDEQMEDLDMEFDSENRFIKDKVKCATIYYKNK